MFQHIFRTSPVAIILDNLSDRRYVDINPAAARLLGYSREELLEHGQAVWESTLAPAARAELLGLFAAQGRVEHFPCALKTRSGEHHDCLLSIESLEHDGDTYVITHIVDISAQKHVEQALAHATTRLQLLADASAAFAAAGMDEQALLATLARRTAEALGAGCIIRLRDGGDPWLRVATVYDPDPALREAVAAIVGANPLLIDSPHPAAQVVRSGQPQRTPMVDLDALRAQMPPELTPTLDDQPVHSGLIAPLRAHEQTLGCIVLIRHQPGQPPFTQDDLTLAQDLADRAGLALANARLYQDMQAAQQAARQSHAQLDALITSLPTGVGYFDRDLRYQLVNPALAAINGRSPAQHIGKPMAALVPALAPQIEPLLRQVLTSGTAIHDLEFPGTPHPSGHGYYTWLASYFPVPGPAGAVAGVGVTLTDITASKRAEEQLRQSEARFATIFERSPIPLGIARMDDSGFTDVNAANLALFGYPREAVIGHTALELGIWVYPEQRQHVMQQLQAHQRITNFETVVRTASGEERSVLFSAEVVEINNEPQVLTQVSDITDLKRAQQELQELNRTLEERVRQRTAEIQDLYDHAPAGYYSTDAEGCLTRVNQTILDWLDYTRAEVLGRRGLDFLAPEIRDTFAAQVPAFKARGQVQGLETWLLRKDGSSFPVLLSATSIYDADGSYVSNRATVLDNTERKQAEDALRESEEQNRLLFEESPAAMALIDLHERIVRANRAFAQLVGHPIERVQEQPLATLGLLAPGQIAQLEADIGPAVTGDPGIANAIVTIRHGDGGLRVVEVQVFPLTIHGHWHSLVSVHDLTRERQTEETLRQANAELARAARAKDDFLATMSHELRTPINTILGFSESLQEHIYGPLSERQRGALDAVESAGRHLLSLINDILDLAKVEAGRMDLHLDPVRVAEMCQISMRFVHEQALKKNLRLRTELPEEEARLLVDGVRLKQMLVNLLSNAVKFTPAGGDVGLAVTLDAAVGEARFVVSDTGIGIAPADQGRLFQPFVQLDSALNRAHEGTGLGLALVRRLAAAHGGDVAVESTVGQGSRFTITLPYQPMPGPGGGASSAAHDPSATATDAPRVRVLLAEDNPMNSRALCDYLESRGYKVVVARNGQEALALADEASPQLILMDIQMPGMDGMEAIRRLRALPVHAATPIIALTALAMPGDKERCLAAGASAYMPKPVRMGALIEMIQQLINVSGQ